MQFILCYHHLLREPAPYSAQHCFATGGLTKRLKPRNKEVALDDFPGLDSSFHFLEYGVKVNPGVFS